MKRKMIAAMIAAAAVAVTSTTTFTACARSAEPAVSAVGEDSASAAASDSASAGAGSQAASDGASTGASATASATISLSDGKDITIDTAGTYTVSGTAKNATIYVDAADEDEITILLSGASVTNKDMPAIYVKNAGKVTVETASGTKNTLTVTDAFAEDDKDRADAVIFSKDDLVLKGEGTLSIDSSDNAVRSKDDLKIKSGTYEITSAKNAFRVQDAIEIEDGVITAKCGSDGLHAEDDDDDTKGSILITGGTISITAGDDAVHATTTIQVDDGSLTLSGAEGFEGTQITVNGGKIAITATDDGINAAAKASGKTPTFEMNGGSVNIKMGAGDTDGVDSNGNIYINGGTIDITGQSTFDYDGEAKYTGGTIIENGTETNSITNSPMGGGRGQMMPGGNQGQMMPGGNQNQMTPDGGHNGNFGQQGGLWHDRNGRGQF